ncbi:MAG: ribosome assembly cofactor RimP [Bacteroidetes bacterium]|nr:MAG: ribosome assembly cofactor RimP [Bacteroidota bacterium]
MINKKDIESVVNDYLDGGDMFLVEVFISKANVINVLVDGDEGMPISECVNISRQIEARYDRDEEDYELKVSSPGLDRPFKLFRQYEKYVGKEIEVLLKGEKKETGVLKSLTEKVINVEVIVGKKKKDKEIVAIPFGEILETKAVISFKK